MDATFEPVPQQRTRTTRLPNPYKTRFCTSFPKCQRGATCGFAHSREEIRAPVLPIEEEQCQPCAMTSEFFINRYKTLWCPIGAQHDWLACPYAHSYQDARRDVSIGYGVKPCPYWNKSRACEDYEQRCPLGVSCPYAHGAKEQLYHPSHFKKGVCRDFRKNGCPRGAICAFYHKVCEKRSAAADHVNYEAPLPQDRIPKEWAARFLAPPSFSEDGSIPSNEQCYPSAVQADIQPPNEQCYPSAIQGWCKLPPNDKNTKCEFLKHDIQGPLGEEKQCRAWDKVSMLEPAFISIETLSSFCKGGEPALISPQQWLEQGLAKDPSLAIGTVDALDILPPPGLEIALIAHGLPSTRSTVSVSEPDIPAPPGLEKGLVTNRSSTTSSTVSDPDDDDCHSEDEEDFFPYYIGAQFEGLYSPEVAKSGSLGKGGPLPGLCVEPKRASKSM